MAESESFEDLEISCLDVKKQLDEGRDFKLLDVRTEHERTLATIEGTELVTQEMVEEMLASWPKDTEIVLYCHTGIRSLQATQFFRERGGFPQTRSMAGGIAAWSANVDDSVPQY